MPKMKMLKSSSQNCSLHHLSKLQKLFMDVKSNSSILYDNSLMVAVILLRTVAAEKKISATIKRTHCHYIDKLRDVITLSIFYTKIEQSEIIEKKWADVRSAYHKVGSECPGSKLRSCDHGCRWKHGT